VGRALIEFSGYAGRTAALSKDISGLMEGWDYEPEGIQVRIILGDDGHEKIQTRVDLGILQMDINGRPDGTRPEGYESLLDALLERAREAESTGNAFALDSPTCQELMREGVQYYQRYLAAFHLQRFDLVARDTQRNLQLFAFVRQHAKRQRDKAEFDQYRPYVTMMRSRALGHQALEKQDFAAALAAIDEGIEAIRQFLRDYGESDNEAECMQLNYLLHWRREVEAERPIGPAERIEQLLALAVSREEYEEAARLRDQLQRLRGDEVGSGERGATR
jgi:hypothetical protein